MNILIRRSRESLILATVAAAIMFCMGCRDPLAIQYESLGLVEVSGTIKLDGQPLSNCTVYFEESESVYSSGVTDSQGHYELMFDSRKSGVTKGNKTVRIKPGTPPSEEGSTTSGEEEDPDAVPVADSKVSVPDCYNKDSKLKVTVSASDSSFDFDLKSDCSTTGKLGG